MDQREITARFEKANVIDPNYPAFDVVCQENVIVILESVDWLAILAHQIQFRPSLRFFREGYERRLIAGIDKRQCYTNPHTNSCPMQSGENLTNSYGPNSAVSVNVHRTDELNNRIPGFPHVALL